MKNELMNIQVELSWNDSLPNAKEKELLGDEKFSVHNYVCMEKIIFKDRNY